MSAPPAFDLVCVSHLWWDWVRQRPQHLMTRIAQRGITVTYVEEPRIEIGPPGQGFDVLQAEAGVRIARMWLRTDPADFRRWLKESRSSLGGPVLEMGPEVRLASLLFESALQPVLRERLRGLFPLSARERPLVLWLYTPGVVDLIDVLRPDVVIYDVMDDLTAFRFAPKALRAQRAELLERAEVIFAGGPSLQASVADERPDALLFPSGVDGDHFAAGRSEGPLVPAALARLRRPIAGYVGVVDERLDLGLLQAAADLCPEWTWVLVGPLLKIDPGSLPSRPNLHFLGPAPYDDLPAYLTSFDVGIMPFAAIAATRSISPTKTLEYLAAGLPVVSTPVPDVIALYGSVVDIADGPESFVSHVRGAAARWTARPRWSADVAALVRSGSWDTTAGRMLEHIESALAEKTTGRPARVPSGRRPS